jgi:hypothetical protein
MAANDQKISIPYLSCLKKYLAKVLSTEIQPRVKKLQQQIW